MIYALRFGLKHQQEIDVGAQRLWFYPHLLSLPPLVGTHKPGA